MRSADRHDLDAVLRGEDVEVGAPRHASVGAHDLADHSCREASGQLAKIDDRPVYSASRNSCGESGTSGITRTARPTARGRSAKRFQGSRTFTTGSTRGGTQPSAGEGRSVLTGLLATPKSGMRQAIAGVMECEQQLSALAALADAAPGELEAGYMRLQPLGVTQKQVEGLRRSIKKAASKIRKSQRENSTRTCMRSAVVCSGTARRRTAR